MKLSIIIPAYNAERFIEKCINSIFVNNYNDIEVLVVNDGSKDKTESICKKLKLKYYNIVLINKENGGVSSARNVGIESATGDYIMFVDSDDLLLSNWHDIIFNNIDLTSDINYYSKELDKNLELVDMIKCIAGNNSNKFSYAGPFSKVYKSSFIKNNGILFRKDIINGEDMLFNIEALLSAQNYNLVSQSFYKYRIYVGSSSKKFSKMIFETDKNFLRIITDIISNSKLPHDFQEDILNFYVLNGIFTLFCRLSYLDNYSEATSYLNFIKEEPYCTKIRNSKFPNSFSLKKKILLYLIKFKQYRITLLILGHTLKSKGTGKEHFSII